MSAKNGNAVAGVKARNGAGRVSPRGRTDSEDRAGRTTLTTRLVALIDREGMVRGVFYQAAEARAFLQGGCL
ncbi:hypothetical protein MPOCJGCO_4639 [Methylobacterium trifolii]|uniref:Uncharacterized protein n=1 Tax=Methylobacterium trifolii TaxID=1003092 RepID=A0ABQ4U4Y0_9HYPH|nr:hypothetical protein MPOCJGCO_4639 [Methylobacterium trifolii]